MNPAPLIHADGCVLAAVDASVHATGVADHAGWAAARLSAPLELLHALEKGTSAPALDLSGNIALGTQETLLSDLAELDARRMALAQERGRMLLAGLQGHLEKAHGVSATVRQRHGSVVDALTDLEPGVRLFVMGRRGEHADPSPGHLGSNLERVVRAVHRPVLIAAKQFKAPTAFSIAFDGSATTRRCIEMICASPLLQGLECHLVMAGEESPAFREQALWARGRLEMAGFSPTMHLQPGEAASVICHHLQTAETDLLVAGAYGHSRIRSLILGSTTARLLRECPVAMLLLR